MIIVEGKEYVMPSDDTAARRVFVGDTATISESPFMSRDSGLGVSDLTNLRVTPARPWNHLAPEDSIFATSDSLMETGANLRSFSEIRNPSGEAENQRRKSDEKLMFALTGDLVRRCCCSLAFRSWHVNLVIHVIEIS